MSNSKYSLYQKTKQEAELAQSNPELSDNLTKIRAERAPLVQDLLNSGIQNPARPKEQKKNSVLDSINSYVVDHTVKGNSPLPTSMITPQSPKHDPRSDYEDARRKLWEYQISQEGKQSAQKDNAYRQAVQERSTGDQLPYKDETLDRLRKDVSDTKAAYESEKNRQHDQPIYEQDMSEISSLTPEELEELKTYVNVRSTDSGVTDPISYLLNSARKKNAAGSLWDKYGEQRLEQLAETYTRDSNAQAAQYVQGYAQRASQGAIGGTAASLGSVLFSPVNTIAAAGGRLDEAAKSTHRYAALSPYTAGDMGNLFFDTAEQSVAQQIAGDNGSELGAIAAGLYQGVMGAGKSMFNAIVLGPTVGAAVSATGQFTRTLSEASQRGATAEQAYLLATSSAAIDYAMDKIPLDRLFSLAKSGSPKAIKAAFKQAGIEMLTEGASFVGAQLLDMAILQENSEYAQNIQAQVDQGVPLSEATRQANKDLLRQSEQQILVAGLSGGISAGVSTAIGNHQAKNAPQDTTPDPTAANPDTQPGTKPQPETPVQPDTQPQDTTVHPQDTQPVEQTPAQESPQDTVSRIVSQATQENQAAQTAARRTVQDTAAGLVSQNGDPNASVGAADQNFTGTARYQDLLSDDNVKPSRASDVRPDEVPEMDGAKRVSDVAKTLMGSKNTTDAAADQVKQLIDSGVFSYDPKTNRQSLQEAAADLDARGSDTIRAEINTHLKNGFVADGDIEKAATLVNQYIQSGDEKAAAEMMGDLSLLAQKSGRNLQMFSLIRRMTPEGQLDTLQQAADRFLSKGKPNQAPTASGTKKGSSAPEPTRANIPVELKNQYIEAARSKDPQRIQEATQAIAIEVGSQYQATFGEKWDTWRYMCMLGNATTNERNIAGNAMFKPYVAVKDKLAAIFEQTIAKDKRTKAFFTDKELLAWAKEDVKSVEAQNALKYSAKLGDDVTTDIFSENKRIFKSNAMETARKVIEWAPSAGDMIFKNGYYSKYLANFLTARGVSAADVRAGNVDPDLMSQARQYAVDNAYINTFNDSNQFSEFMSSAGKLKNSNNAAARVFGRVVDAVLPFRKTPANILVRFKEYSPVEVLEVAAKMAGKGVDKISNGKHGWSRGYTASQFCNDLASGLTGTLAAGAGYALANGIFDSNGNGVRLVAKATDEEKLQGIQDYSIVLTYDGKTTSHSIEWAAPANLPFFVGANVYAASQESQQQEAVGVDKFLNFLEAGTDTLEPLLDLACLSSINDLLQDVKYSEDKAIWKIASSTAVSYVSQAIPSLLRQTNTVRQTEKQTTFANHHNKMGREIQRTVSNIPFVGEALGLKTDKIGVWGEKEDQGSLGKRVFNSYLNPVKTTEVKTDATTAEISRLAKTPSGTGVVPEVAPKTLTYEDKNGETHKDVRLTAQQWESYATTRGKTSKQVLDRMIQSKDYQELTDSGKAAAIDLVYQYADKTGAIAAMKDHDGYPETWMKEASEAASPAQYILQKVSNRQMQNAMGNLVNAWSHGQDRAASKKQLEDAYDSYAASSETLKEAVKKAAEGAVSKYLEARDDNVSSDVALSIIRQVQSIPQKDRGKARYQYQAISKTPGLSDDQMDKAMKLYMPDYDKEEKKPVKTEPRYDYIRQQLGFSPQEYAAAAYAMSSEEADTDESGSVTKNEAVKAIMDLGYDRQTATWFWGIYSGSGGNAYKNALNRFISENY